MNVLYPEIEPYEDGFLDVGDGQQIYWEACGNPAGKPVLVLHGGPGSGCTARMRRFFDPDAYRIILFDQRGCGRSLPHASDPTTDLSTNTTWHLVADIERVREALGVEKWMVFGGSWGSTLGLVYAETHAARVREIVLWGVALSRPAEIRWLYEGVAPLFPAQWADFVRGMPEPVRAEAVVEAYFQRLHDPDPAVRLQAARDFHAWEWALFTTVGNESPSERWLNPAFQLARARIVTHYFRNNVWLDDLDTTRTAFLQTVSPAKDIISQERRSSGQGFILEHADRLAGIPGVMVHGRMDVGSPLVSAWELARVWRAAELVVVSGAGHSTSDPGMDEALVAATRRFGV